jgi:glutamine synthetase
MKPNEVKTAADVRAIVEERGLRQVKVGVFDIDGVLNGKYMSRDKFLSALDGGFGFCDVVLGWDVDNQLYDNTTLTGWHKGYSDAPVRLIPESCRELPLEDNMLFFLAEFAGNHEALCPRATLRRTLEKAASLGFDILAACEYEFLVLDEDGPALRAKGFRNMTPLGTGNCGYSVLRNSVNAEFYRGLLDLCEAMDMPIEGLHEEMGPGALEAAITVDRALVSADRAALFKTFSKVYAQRQKRNLSFMAKWDPAFPGQGGHTHMSLKAKDGTPVFYDLVPGYWAPTAATWGVDNRTVAIRAIPGSAKSQRVEFRVPGADANPYLAMSAAFAAGLWGVEHKIEPTPAAEGNAYLQEQPESLQLPRTLWEGAQRFKASTLARDAFGDAFVDHYSATREWEEREFRKHVSDWELKRYFELI